MSGHKETKISSHNVPKKGSSHNASHRAKGGMTKGKKKK